MVEPDVLLAEAIEELCGSQRAGSLNAWPWTEVKLPEGLRSPTISALTPDTGSVESELDEVLSDGSQLRTVRDVQAELQVEGTMTSWYAEAAASGGLVTILGSAAKKYDVCVSLQSRVAVELDFTATINPENGMVYQIELDSMSAW